MVRRLILALVLGQLGVHAVMGGLRLAATLQALREGYSTWTVGLLLALFSLAQVVIAFPAGRMADRAGYHRPVALAVGLTMLGALMAFASTWAPSVWPFVLLCAAAVATGAGTNVGMMTIQRAAGMAAGDSTERVRVFSWLGMAPPLANVIGPVMVGFLIDAWGFRAAYGALLLLPLITLVSSRFVPDMRPIHVAPVVANRRAWDLLHIPGMPQLMTVNWLMSMCWDVHTFAVPIISHERGLSAGTVGLIMASFTATVTMVRFFIPFIAGRVEEVTVLKCAMLGAALVFAVYPLAPNAWLMGACSMLLGVALGSVQPMLMSVLHHLTPDSRHGESLALRSLVSHASSTVMPLVFGASGVLMGAGVLFWLVGAATGVGAWATRHLPLTR
jgi:MFS family permease